MLSNMAASLILNKRIETTLAKAKELRMYVEPLITKAKNDSTHSRRIVFSYLRDKEPVKELFNVVADKVADRPGGYTRIVKLGTRLGDAAEICMMELVDFNETFLLSEADKPTKTRRSRRGGGKKSTGDPTEVTPDNETAAAKAGVADQVDVVADVVEEKATEEPVLVTPTPTSVEAEVPATVEVEEPVAEAEAPVITEADDLTKVEGIGPKIAEVLAEAGIDTFAKVADSTPEAMREILDNAGSQFASHDPGTWPQQARLAADDHWDRLKTLQDELNGGRE